ncbi:MAG TPA: DolP-mannose mannosyltransferase [Blastocatellia bacterium]|nr:DolP-mannose mannosyltransferase [Blastocatellia bacterium]
MTEPIEQMRTSGLEGKPPRTYPFHWTRLLAHGRVLILASFVVGAAVVLADRPFGHTESGDCSIFDYIAQSIVRGQVPYRDVIDLKGPGSAYLSAAAMTSGRRLGIRDIIAVRWLHVLMMGLLSATTFLVAQAYFENRFAAVLAFLIPLISSGLSSQVNRGTQPKLSMVLFGMISLLLLARDRPFWAGVFSMLACLCWQPGLMFTGVALLISSRYLKSWRDLRTVKVILGAAAPLAIVVLYFTWEGALSDLWAWTVVFPATVFAPETAMPLGKTLTNFREVLSRELQPLSIVALLALAGLVGYITLRVRRRIKSEEGVRSDDLFKDAVAFPAAIYLIFCMINFQSSPDLVPFYPFIGLFAGWLIVEAASLMMRSRPKLARAITMAAIILAATLIILEHAPRGPRDASLQDQDREAQILAGYLGPDDNIYVHGMGEVLVLLNRPNLNKYLALNSGADNFIAAKKPGGFQDVIDEIEAHRPKIVVMTRLRNVRHREEINQWLDEHYEKLGFENLKGVYLRVR